MEEYSEGMYYRRKRSLDKWVPICTIDLINNKSEKKQKSQVDSKSTGPKVNDSFSILENKSNIKWSK